jgi:hypothetical protein
MKYSIFKRLSNQAAASVTSGLRGCDWQLEYDKIFADLIVKECMEQVWYTREDGINGNVSEAIKDRIKQHFGVEE